MPSDTDTSLASKAKDSHADGAPKFGVSIPADSRATADSASNSDNTQGEHNQTAAVDSPLDMTIDSGNFDVKDSIYKHCTSTLGYAQLASYNSHSFCAD